MKQAYIGAANQVISHQITALTIPTAHQNGQCAPAGGNALAEWGRIDAECWAQMQSAATVPFELPDPGIKIAVKVIDQTGTEHMAVLDNPRDPQWY